MIFPGLHRSVLVPLLGLVLCLAAGSPAVADELDSSRQRLAEIQRQIAATLNDLREKRAETGSLASELDKLASETRKLQALARRSEKEMDRQQRQIEQKQADIKQLQAQSAETEKRVAKRLAALYRSGQSGMARILLAAGERPQEIAEKYLFLTRMVRHDRELIAAYRQQAEQERQALADLEELNRKQADLVARRRQEAQTLTAARRAKDQLLADLRQDEKLLDGVLADLRAKAAGLNDLVKRLESDAAQTYTGNLTDFSAQKGRLPWPVPGRVKVAFGTNRHAELGTLLESNGLEIEAEVGTPVKVVAAGKVIYASRLRGYGKLMVVDHGGKYYSLYAQMQRFAKEVGNAVAPGEILAYSGFEGRDTIYFEIRYRGEPQDPKSWLMAR